jgi:hypothetical protein
VTTQRGAEVVYVGQAQRPKVLKWPNRDVLIGYVGQAEIAGLMTDQWLYSYIGRNLDDSSFEELGGALADDLEGALGRGEIDSPLILHLGGFERVNGVWEPRIWYVHNVRVVDGVYDVLDHFVHREELRQPAYFGGQTSAEIREYVRRRVFSYRQGFDLDAFNLIDDGLREAMRQIVHQPGAAVPIPATLADWEKHTRLSILGYGAYFGAFYEPFEQYVGGGADVVYAPWPD